MGTFRRWRLRRRLHGDRDLVEVMDSIPEGPDRGTTERLVYGRIARNAKALADELETGGSGRIRRQRLEQDLERHRELLKQLESADVPAKRELERLIRIETRLHTDAAYDEIHRRMS